MTDTDALESIVEAVFARHRVPRTAPWRPNDEKAVDALLRDTVAALAEHLRAQVRAEFDHYGSGSASFVDAWFFRPDPSFRRESGDGWEAFTGLTVLFSRLGPVVCFLESHKGWSDAGARSSSMPQFEGVDALTAPAISALRADAEPWLSDRGFLCLSRADLGACLPTTVVVPTLLANGPLREFDALFHWED